MRDAAGSSAEQARLARLQRLVEEVAQRRHLGESLPDEELLQRHQDLLPELKQRLAAIAEPLNQPLSDGGRAGENPSLGTTVDGQFGDGSEDREDEPLPASIGRYAIRGRLGHGGFGTVYLGYDSDLEREVAIKVLRSDRVRDPADMEAFLAESRLVAMLDHPHIVPVYDVGRGDDGRCFVVSKRIDGDDLRKRMELLTRDYRLAARVVATVARALHYAHGRDITHRDIKPENILLDTAGQPYVADFGLALKEELFGEGSGYAGTPLYWSPEQARGEGHRVDGRSDIFSLGVVLYELLTSRRPFKGSSTKELAHCIQIVEARPPRQIDDSIPRELERICLKSLSKRATDRYTTASDMAADIHRFLDAAEPPRAHALGDSTGAGSETPIRIIPKGLRSFDQKDAGFFLELLPGPRDREGLPQSIRFWKTRIEETDAEDTFSVGLIYGPSGCGKSSLLKAGLLPHLAGHVVPVYVEATPADTESRLLRVLRKSCEELPTDLGLVDTLATIRRSYGLPPGRKVLIVLDQFEQWLHAPQSAGNPELIQALRQCDGEHVQCIVMVRDDFWLAVSRFMQDLEIRLVEAENSHLVDLFDPRHARSVLIRFGQAFDALPQAPQAFTPLHEEFLDQVVAALSDGGKVISVRLALFAEMVKGKPWTPDTLTAVGGAEGIGVTFLEETFSGRTAPPEHRLHQQAARAVLKSLLPESGTDIKGGMRSRAELLDAAGYATRPRAFAVLLEILDRQLRLITPTDPEGLDRDDERDSSLDPGDRYYQLTHDYLVPSLRQWLTQKQQETRRGRAELRLAERSGLWKARPEKARLPALWEYLNIVALTRWQRWTTPERQMMSAATRYFSTRTAALVLLTSLLAWGAYDSYGRFRASALVDSLEKAGPDKALEIAAELQPWLPWASEDLRRLVARKPETADQARQQLHARLALVATDDTQLPPLIEALLTASPRYVAVIRNAARPLRERVVETLWEEFRREQNTVDRRFRAATTLADYMPGSEQWKVDDFRFLAEQLLAENPRDQPVWLASMRSVSDACTPHWERVFADQEASESQLIGAANALAEYAVDDQERVARVLSVANPKQYATLFPLIASNPTEAAKSSLATMAATLPPEDLSTVDRIVHGQRRGGAGITLLRLGERESVLATFDLTDDPEAIAQFIHRCRDREVQAGELLECLRIAATANLDPRVLSLARYALLLALAEYPPGDIPAAERAQLINDVADWYAFDPSSTVHGAAGWLLRAWGQEDTVRQVDETPVAYAPGREWFTLAVTVTPAGARHAAADVQDADQTPDEDQATRSETDDDPTETGSAETAAGGNNATGDPPTPDQGDRESNEPSNPPHEEESSYEQRTFYYTFIVFPAGAQQIGSFSDEPDRNSNEDRHEVYIAQSFALLDREVTFAECIAFDPLTTSLMRDAQVQGEPTDPAAALMWYEAVAYCRWLSQQAGLSEDDQAYPDPNSLDSDQFPRESNPSADWAPRDWPIRLDRRGFRLPTEAEWEVACRGGMRTAYGQGSDTGLLTHYAWYAGNSGKQAHRPKTRRPGPRGLFDIHGNSWEWCHDWYGSYPAPEPARSSGGSHRVRRGGGWNLGAASCRSSHRYSNIPPDRYSNLGFRLAVTPSSQEAEEQDRSLRGAEAVDEGRDAGSSFLPEPNARHGKAPSSLRSSSFPGD